MYSGRNRENREEPRRSDPLAMWGFVLQFLAYGMLFAHRGLPDVPPSWMLIGGAALGPVSVVLSAFAVHSLGRQFNVKAVITRAHRLVTTGPYAVVRHPIYTSMLLLLFATGLIVAPVVQLLVAVVVFTFGTEIRIRAEEGLLHDHFGREFTVYRERVPAWIPFVR